MKYKLGDKIRVVNVAYFDDKSAYGKIGEIIEVTCDSICIKLYNWKGGHNAPAINGKNYNNSDCWYVGENDIEPVYNHCFYMIQILKFILEKIKLL